MPEGYLLTTHEFAVDHPVEWTPHVHGEHELLWCESGMARLEADGRMWAIPPALAVWVPAGVVHAAAAVAGAAVRATYFVEHATTLAEMPAVVTGVAMTEPVRVLLMHNLQGQLDEDARLRLQRVVLDLLTPVPRQSFDLVMPHSAHLREIASAVVSDPAGRETTEYWAYRAGVHPRTLARQFEAETGISFTQWRIQTRMQVALRELSHGRPVLSVARAVGYRSPSAFIDHFRAMTGQAPAEYVSGLRRGRQ